MNPIIDNITSFIVMDVLERANEMQRRRYMISRLRQMGFGIPRDPQGAFYIFADARRFTHDSLQFAFDILEHAHVGITPGIDFGTGGEGFVRFSYANSLENIREGLDRIDRYLNSLRPQNLEWKVKW